MAARSWARSWSGVALALALVLSSADSAQALSIEIEPSKPIYHHGEPVLFSITLLNESIEDTVWIPVPIAQVGEEIGISLRITPDGGTEYRRFCPAVSVRLPSTEGVQIPPGESVHIPWVAGGSWWGWKPGFQAPCDGEEFCWDFPFPSSYEVKAVFQSMESQEPLWMGTVESSPVTITIVPIPQGQELAYSEWSRSGAAKGFSVYGGFAKRSYVDDLRAYYEALPPSGNPIRAPYRVYFDYLYALSEPDPQQRASLLEDFLDGVEPHEWPLYDGTLYELSQALTRGGSEEQAELKLGQLRRTRANSVYLLIPASLASR